MAIWQFNLTAVPRKSMLDKYGVIPVMLERESLDDCCRDLWALAPLDIMEITGRIDRIVTRADYGNNVDWFNWKTYTDEVDNDASLSLNNITGKIESLHFRADLREKELIYLKQVIELAKNYEWMLVDLQGNVITPSLEEVEKFIRVSNAYRFLSNPIKFLEDFEKGDIKPE